VSTQFISKIINQGNVSTLGPFYNSFQIATKGGGKGEITTIASTPSPMLELRGGYTDTATSVPYTFMSKNTYSVRACADKNTSFEGMINEEDENNNCSGWRNVVVRDGDEIDGYWTSSCGACDQDTCQQQCTWSCTNPQNGGKECPIKPADFTRACQEGPSCGGGGELNIIFTAMPTKIFKGGSSTLSWTSVSGARCEEVEGVGFDTGDSTPADGNDLVSPVTTTKYIISCTKGGVTETAEATVKVDTFIEREG